MRHASLFSGIGGFDLAAAWMGWENVFQVEIDPFCQKVLQKNFPNVTRYGDIKQFDGTKYRGAIDILTGGPPCQPASQAGKRKGEDDDRWLWPEALRILGEIMPGIAVFENPDDLLTLDNGRPFERICLQMETLGYKVETYGIPAACVGAWHERDRIWIIAYSNNFHESGELDSGRAHTTTNRGKRGYFAERKALEWQRIRPESGSEVETVPNINTSGLSKPTRTEFRRISKTDGAFQGSQFGGIHAASGRYWEAEPGVGRMVHGIPDRAHRIKSLGNAIVPQVAFEIFKAISLTIPERR